MTRRTAVLLALATVAVTVFIVWAVVAAPSPSSPQLSASNSAPTETASPEITPSPSSSAAPTPLKASSDPCHSGGVTYCALNPAVTVATIRSTICVSGWTSTVRPPESYTEPLKLQQMAAEGLTGSPSNYEEDHRMPLELGGDPRDPMNLSPESHSTSLSKDAAENAARQSVCAGADLRTVQTAFVATWLGSFPTYAK